MKERKFLKLDNFWLKIIACVTMTIDHVALFLSVFPINGNIILSTSSTLYFILRVIGRMALPIFLFLITEGVQKTKNIKKYMLKLGIMATLISIILIILNSSAVGFTYLSYQGNIFLDLFFCVLIYYLFTHEKKLVKYLTALPILYIVGISVVKILAMNDVISTNFILEGLYLQYDFIGIVLFIGIFIGYRILNNYVDKGLDNNKELIESYKRSSNFQYQKNMTVLMVILIESVILCLVEMVLEYVVGSYSYIDLGLESYILLGAIPIIFYSGKLGYSNKYIQSAFYLYYPLHIALIYLILILI